jgi:thermostable 8-oxoguanine DNA glycosylase
VTEIPTLNHIYLWSIRHLISLVTLIINIYGLGWGSRSHFLKQISQWIYDQGD